MAPVPVAMNKLEEFGINAVCEAVANGRTMTALAADIGVSFGSLSVWLAADPERSARVKAIREVTAIYWDEMSETELRAAKGMTGVARARELAFHYRWRASKIAPSEYGEKSSVDVTVTANIVSDLELGRKRMQERLKGNE